MSDDTSSPATTDDAGLAAPSDEFSLSAGAEGPLLLQDHYLLQKMPISTASACPSMS